ncbi:MAG TPA: PIG-L family deacetylase [Patescibacteria group bacterium]|nr:PIG-L family deacetylase [Patescibacteria group bacterium]HPD74362.1 PIG-L family deacetylase [bacterium]HRY56845.1 PIG-L family deacetylase [Patescibacteria group bacterium]
MNLEKLNISKNSKVLFIYPHPDDETYFNAGLIQNLVKENITTRILCLTKGEASSLKYGIKHNNLGEIRKKEFESVMKFLKVSEHKILDFEDGNLGNENSLSEILEKEINLFEPDVVITFEPSGVYGHRDHIVVSQVVTDLKKLRKFNLIYSTVPFNYHTSQKNSLNFKIDSKPLEPDMILKLSPNEVVNKLICLIKYKSQVNNERLIQIILKPYLYKECYCIYPNL